MEYVKRFDEWNRAKKHLHHDDRKVYIRRGEIRWVACGVNIGSEIDGKGVSFTRPALILHVVGTHLALVIPLSTKVKQVAGYFPLQWKNQTRGLCIHQLRVVSQKRILGRLGRISENKLKQIKEKVSEFFQL